MNEDGDIGAPGIAADDGRDVQRRAVLMPCATSRGCRFTIDAFDRFRPHGADYDQRAALDDLNVFVSRSQPRERLLARRQDDQEKR